MTGREALERLVRHYVERARPEIAAREWDRIRSAGLDDVTFAWAGPDEPGRGHYYAVRGPQFLVEYDNTQNGANHIHAVWRDLANDWGEDLLATHYAAEHARRRSQADRPRPPVLGRRSPTCWRRGRTRAVCITLRWFGMRAVLDVGG